MQGYDSQQVPAVQGFKQGCVMDEKLLSPLFPVGVCVFGRWGGGAGGVQWLQMTGAFIVKLRTFKQKTPTWTWNATLRI